MVVLRIISLSTQQTRTQKPQKVVSYQEMTSSDQVYAHELPIPAKICLYPGTDRTAEEREMCVFVWAQVVPSNLRNL